MATAHGPVHGDPLTRRDEHDISDAYLCERQALWAVRPTHRRRGRETVEQILYRSAPTRHRQPFEDLGDQHEERDDQRRDELPDNERGSERNRHRQLHRHAPLAEVLPRLLEDRPPADDRAEDAKDADSRQRLPDP